jgi:hypothetical protein
VCHLQCLLWRGSWLELSDWYGLAVVLALALTSRFTLSTLARSCLRGAIGWAQHSHPVAKRLSWRTSCGCSTVFGKMGVGRGGARMGLGFSLGLYHFDLLDHIPGCSNFAPNCLSRLEAPQAKLEPESLRDATRIVPRQRGVSYLLATGR